MAGRDPVTGRNRQLSKTVRGSKTQARQRLNALVAEAQSGRYDGTSATFEQLANKWLHLVEDDLSPTTLRGYRNTVKVKIFPDIGDRPVNKINTQYRSRLYRGLD